MTDEKLTVAEYLEASKKPEDMRPLYGEQRAWTPVLFAHDCQPCDMCGQPLCPNCDGLHYADCPCPGPSQDDEFEYKTINQCEFARRLEDATS